MLLSKRVRKQDAVKFMYQTLIQNLKILLKLNCQKNAPFWNDHPNG